MKKREEWEKRKKMTKNNEKGEKEGDKINDVGTGDGGMRRKE